MQWFSWRADVFEDLHAVIVGIGHVDLVVRADGYPRRNAELTRLRSRFAPVHQQPSGKIKDLDVVEHSIDHVDVAEGIRRDALWPREMSRRIARAADLGDKFA